jgi:hypothetical protein
MIREGGCSKRKHASSERCCCVKSRVSSSSSSSGGGFAGPVVEGGVDELSEVDPGQRPAGREAKSVEGVDLPLVEAQVYWYTGLLSSPAEVDDRVAQDL